MASVSSGSNEVPSSFIIGRHLQGGREAREGRMSVSEAGWHGLRSEEEVRSWERISQDPRHMITDRLRICEVTTETSRMLKEGPV